MKTSGTSALLRMCLGNRNTLCQRHLTATKHMIPASPNLSTFFPNTLHSKEPWPGTARSLRQTRPSPYRSSGHAQGWVSKDVVPCLEVCPWSTEEGDTPLAGRHVLHSTAQWAIDTWTPTLSYVLLNGCMWGVERGGEEEKMDWWNASMKQGRWGLAYQPWLGRHLWEQRFPWLSRTHTTSLTGLWDYVGSLLL